jgi:DNA-binding NtrC family response regulator
LIGEPHQAGFGPPASLPATLARTLATRSLIVVSPDVARRQRVAAYADELGWRVRVAGGGAEALLLLETGQAEALIADAWLPDLEAGEFTDHVRRLYPQMDLLILDCDAESVESAGTVASPRRSELLTIMRQAAIGAQERQRGPEAYRRRPDGSLTDGTLAHGMSLAAETWENSGDEVLPGLIGSGEAMQELAELVRLVAGRQTTVLIEGETGKEVVARAIHLLSARAAKPLAVLNCAAIPESLLEAELFGHRRGAFTGAVQSRMGRIEATHGGTLLLDEIGEMPLAMQAKMLRFLESGELQRVGDNAVTQVDVRLIAATHQPLEWRSAQGTFRLDLYHRLAVFPIHVPCLRERMEDLPVLIEHFLARLARDTPRKRLGPGALTKLMEHGWPGNVRELMHVLERAVILSADAAVIHASDVRYRRASREVRATSVPSLEGGRAV